MKARPSGQEGPIGSGLQPALESIQLPSPRPRRPRCSASPADHPPAVSGRGRALETLPRLCQPVVTFTGLASSRLPAPSSTAFPGPSPMTLVNAAYLGIERFSLDRNKENWSNATENDKAALIRAV